MEGEELGGTFVVAVEELGITGLWTTIREVSSSSPVPCTHGASLRRWSCSRQCTHRHCLQQGFWFLPCHRDS